MFLVQAPSHVLTLGRVPNRSTKGLLVLRIGAQRRVEPRCHPGQPDLWSQPMEACLV